MSILLEALRKSEKNQRAHEVPTIHSDDQSGPASEPLKTGPLALLLVVALFTSGWFVWHQYRAPVAAGRSVAANEQPQVSTRQTATAASVEPAVGKEPPAVSEQAPLAKTVDPSAAGTTPLASDEKNHQARASTKLADNTVRRQRTPVESYKPPASSTSKSKSTEAQRLARKYRETQVADAGSSQPTAAKASPDKPVTVTKQEPVPQEPAPISYWELPDAVRANLPEIKFSVLVYAQNPVDRFVLINGQRLREGDSPLTDLVVKEIRRDGVVFSYRLYQFLVEK